MRLLFKMDKKDYDRNIRFHLPLLTTPKYCYSNRFNSR